MPHHPILMKMAKAPTASGLDIHEEGLVCYVDAGLTDSYSGSGLTWTDLSPESNDHTWDSTAPSHTSGTSGYFDFTQAATDETAGGTTNLSTGAGSWTIEAWFYTDSITAWQSIWWIGTNATTGGAQGMYLGITDGGAIFIETAAGTTIFGSTLTASTWYSAVVTYNGSTIELFLDNSSEGTASATLNITFGTFVIGQDSIYSDRLDGRLAAIIVYDDLLTSGERGTNYTEHTSRY